MPDDETDPTRRWADPAQWAQVQERLERQVAALRELSGRQAAAAVAHGRRADAAEARIEAALLHYRIGEEAAAEFFTETGELVVSWRYVAQRMADALRGEKETR